jgi:hypothetical protein
MSRVSLVLALVAVAALVGFVVGPVCVAQERVVSGPSLGPYLTIVKKSNPASSIDLEKVRIEKLDGRSFLVGTGADTPDNWQKGKTVWVALDDVSEMTSFATLEELRKAGTLQDVPRAENPPKK